MELALSSFLSRENDSFGTCGESNKRRIENVETLIYMRFRGRSHSLKTPKTFHVPAYRELISMQLFHDCSRRPDRFFFRTLPIYAVSDANRLDFWIILLAIRRRGGGRSSTIKEDTPTGATRVAGKIPGRQMPVSLSLSMCPISRIYISIETAS